MNSEQNPKRPNPRKVHITMLKSMKSKDCFHKNPHSTRTKSVIFNYFRKNTTNTSELYKEENLNYLLMKKPSLPCSRRNQ